ncbi:MAG: PP2C family serine/threonine-protein phosphatase [Gammaproteobacteria bacterium]|nr:PP2C family serine/threonine-protein phosphatase [Gammaproteobacteria bacterium]
MRRQPEPIIAQMHFKNLDGKPILDPRPDMLKFPERHTDYQAEHPSTQTHIAELWGRRPTQEDSFVINEFRGLTNLSSLGVSIALNNTIDALSLQIQEKQLRDGATLCATVLCGNILYNANVGDSESFLVIKDKDNNITTFERLNIELHDLNDSNVDKLRRQGLKINSSNLYANDHRLPYPDGQDGVNMYRAMGDLIFEHAGMSHKADIRMREVFIPEGGSAFVINACDGLTEAMTHEQLKKVLSDNKNKNLDKLALLLANAAYRSGSSDNISVLVTPVTPGAPPKYLAIFDGHAGTSVSHFLGSHFDTVFMEQYLAQFQSELLSAKHLQDLQVKTKSIFNLKDRIQKCNPEANWTELYTELTLKHYSQLQQENDLEIRSQMNLEYLSQLQLLLTSIYNALMVRSNLELKLPSSFSPEFKDDKTNPKIKDAVAFVETKAKAALIAFHNIPMDNTKDAYFNTLLQDLNMTINQSVDMINQANYMDAAQPTQQLIAQILKRIEGKPYYQSAIDELKTINQKLTLGEYGGDHSLDKILFAIYIDAEKLNMEKGLFSSSNANKEIRLWLEKILMNRNPLIQTATPPSKNGNTLQKRLLWYAGEQHNDLALKIKLDLERIKEDGKSPQATKDNKKLFIHTAKLLAQLGQPGFDACSEFFKSAKKHSVSESEMATYYEKEVATKAKAMVNPNN